MTENQIQPALSAVSSTLRIPLAARALGDSLFPQLAAGDAHAGAMLSAMGDNGQLWLRDRQSVYGVLARTRCFRELAAGFLVDQADGHVVNLGCGLSHYFQWLDNGRAQMTDADLPEVLALRHALLPAQGTRHQLRELDLATPDWWDRLELARGTEVSNRAAPLFLFSEGVLMYLTPEMVNSVLATFAERAPTGSLFAFDALSWLAAGRARLHPSAKHTGAQFHWGLRRPKELLNVHPRLRLHATYKVMEGYGWPHSLMGPLFRALTGVLLYGIYVLRVADDDRSKT